MRALFRRLDNDSDGCLTIAEFSQLPSLFTSAADGASELHISWQSSFFLQLRVCNMCLFFPIHAFTIPCPHSHASVADVQRSSARSC